ncbi:amino acid adenylation domain-containing protein, partial [Streptomyces sp. NPDC050548]|uniref:amino acid adenylation domain-containing protein n=1 Tax=Streptomyces sp. NPDC050548 TaxID=3365629 RepID=UPI00378C7A27
AGVEEATRLAPVRAGRVPVAPERVTVVLPEELSAGLSAAARRCGVTLNTVVQQAWAMLLGHMTGQDDVVFGATVSGRPAQIPGVESMGLSINTVPVRVRLKPGEVLREALVRLQGEQSVLLAHQHLKLTDIHGLTPAGELFDTVVAFENPPVEDEIFEQATSAQVHDAGHYPMSLRVLPGDRIEFRMEYGPDLFARGEVEGLGRRFVRVLRAVVETPEVRLGRVGMLDESERGRALSALHGRVEGGEFRDVVDRVRDVARQRPDAVAVTDDGGDVTYGVLVSRASALSKRLVGRGIGAGALVGILSDPGAGFVGSVLGVFGCRAGYIPLDPQAPVARSAAYVADSGAGCLLTEERYLERAQAIAVASGGAVEVLVMDDGQDDGVGWFANGSRGFDIAYSIFTSGSTGRPKGAVVDRAGMENHLLAKIGDLGLSSSDRVMQNAPLTFNISVWQMFAVLMLGGRVRVVDRTTAADPRELFRRVADEGVSVLEVVPSLLRAALDMWDAGGERVVLPGLRWLVVTGEALPGGLCERWFARYPGIPLVNAYGSTECSDDVSHAVITSGDFGAERKVTIGRPIRNMRLYVLNEALQPVAVGMPGDLYVSGVGVGQGYVGDADRTAAAFVADPYSGVPGARMYRMGDYVRCLPDGRLEFVERRDHQVKIRGQRLELGEIETVLAEHVLVGQAAVVLREDTPGDKRLAAYVVPGAGAPTDVLDPAVLREHVAGRLPEYMVPSAFVVLDALPLTLNGKLDRRALPAPEYAAGVGRGPRTSREEILCGLFAEVLGVESVSIDDSFFELGGHSLLATRLVSRIRAVLGIEVGIRALFEAPTVAGLVERLDEGVRVRERLGVRVRPEVLPVSFAQRRLWFLGQLEGVSATYNIPLVLRLTGTLDVGALQAALGDVAGRHESLRTVFPQVDGEPRQEILTGAAGVPYCLVEQVPEPEVAAAISAVVTAGFDLALDLPWRVRVLQPAPDEWILVVVVHHIAADAWSMGPLVRDLSLAYVARYKGEAPVWDTLPVQYADYTLWQREVLGDEDDPESVLAEQVAYWTRALNDLPEQLELPVDFPRPAVASHEGASVPVHVSAETHARLVELSRSCGASVFMTVQAALAVLLSKMGAGHDIPIGTPIAGRTDDALDDLVGFFVNTLVLRTDVSGDPTFRQVVERVREADLAAYVHQDVPFERLVEVLNPIRSMARHPLFQVMLTVQHHAPLLSNIRSATTGSTTEHELDLPNLTVRPESTDGTVAKFDLSVSLGETHTDSTPAGLEGRLDYRTDLFEAATVELLAQRLVHLLDTVTADPDTPVRSIDVVDAGEREQVLLTWNDTASEVPEATLTELFEAQALRTPDAIAVVSGGVELTYAQLNEHADRLAGHLASQGAGPERAVGLWMERSAKLVTVLLAVLKTGAHYVPLHEGHPPSRLRLVLEDCEPELLVTDRPAQASEFAGTAQIISPDAALEAVSTAERVQRAGTGGADGLAYVMYTSGSTGEPKGVAVTHRGVADLVLNRCWKTDNHERVLFHSPHAFDASTFELWFPLLSGGTIVVAPEGTLDATSLEQLIKAHEISGVVLTAGLFRVIAEETPACLAQLREVLTGGDVVSPVAVRRVLEACPDTVVRVLYG